MPLHRTYTRTLFSELGYRATWLPGAAVALGQVGVLDAGSLTHETSLEALGVDAPVTEQGVPEGSLDVTSHQGVSVSFKAAGSLDERFKVVGTADAGALVQFSREDAVVVELKGVRSHRFVELRAVKEALLDAVVAADDQARWDRDWMVVTEVVVAETATVLVSSSSHARVELRAKGSVTPQGLADAELESTPADRRDVGALVVAERGLTPLYKALRVRRNFWWLYDEVVPASGEVPNAEDLFADADPAEDLED